MTCEITIVRNYLLVYYIYLLVYLQKSHFRKKSTFWTRKWVEYILIEMVPETSTSVSRGSILKHSVFIETIHKNFWCGVIVKMIPFLIDLNQVVWPWDSRWWSQKTEIEEVFKKLFKIKNQRQICLMTSGSNLEKNTFFYNHINL